MRSADLPAGLPAGLPVDAPAGCPTDAPADVPADVGLLATGWAGSPVEAATGDHAFLQAMLDAEAALTRAQAELGLAPAASADAVTAAAGAERFDARSLAPSRCAPGPEATR